MKLSLEVFTAQFCIGRDDFFSFFLGKKLKFVQAHLNFRRVIFDLFLNFSSFPLLKEIKTRLSNIKSGKVIKI